MKFLLDTHILIWLAEKPSELSMKVKEYLDDYENSFFVSIESLREIVIKQKSDEIKLKVSFPSFVKSIKEAGIRIVNTEINHILEIYNLNIPNGHKDPFDHLIIATAIAGKFSLISSDHKFCYYQKQGLDLIVNIRP